MSDATYQEFVLGAATTVIENAGETLAEGATYQEAVIHAAAVIIAGGGGGGGASDAAVAALLGDGGTDSYAAVEAIAIERANAAVDNYARRGNSGIVAVLDGSATPVQEDLAASAGGLGTSVVFDGPGRLRVYSSAAQRTADLARPAGTDPTGNHGVLLDFVATVAGEFWLSPPIYFWSQDGTNDIPATVNGPASTTLTVALKYQQTKDGS